jgi:arabinan endo-1,5-alpha-L-arabinosidase
LLISTAGASIGNTLDPTSPDWGWQDQGPVITSSPQKPFNAIDPALFRDDDGTLWMPFGSYWEGIHLVQLHPESGHLSVTS